MQSYKNLKVIVALTFLIGSLSLLSGCGGGGSTAATPTENGGTTGTNGMISGTAVKGPVRGGTVTAYSISNGTMGAQLASGTTDSQGNFTMSIGSYTGPVMLRLSGGAYIDEATGTGMTMDPGDVMTAVISSATATSMSGIQITPLTSMAQAMAQHMSGGLAETNITAANTAVGTYFMINNILHTKPMNPLISGSGIGATQDAKNYGMTIAAMTQYANTIGMTDSSGIVTAMMEDASDGVMNGMMGNTSITMGGGMMGGTMMQSTAGTSGLADAMTAFIANTSENKSGLMTTNMQALIDQLSASSGQIQGSGGAGTTGTSGMISGTVYNGSVGGATIMAFAVNSGTLGAQLASVTTDKQGNFTMSLGTYSGPLMLRMTGATYTDLATGATLTASPGDLMTAVIPSVTSGETVTGIQITPLTSMAQARAQYMTGGMTGANITAANTAVGNYFMVSDILHTQPVNTLVQNSGTGATQDAEDYGVTIAAMLQYAQNIGMTDPFAIVTAMMDDASDGVMNGMMGSTQITMGGMGGGMMGSGTMMDPAAGTSDLATAMTQFIGSTLNESGVTTTDVQTLINQLGTSNGTL
jgi:hypothetical protein